MMTEAFAKWYWRTWPKHVLADPEARSGFKEAVDIVTAMIGLALIAVLVNRKPPQIYEQSAIPPTREE